jgi:hypothetical protein
VVLTGFLSGAVTAFADDFARAAKNGGVKTAMKFQDTHTRIVFPMNGKSLILRLKGILRRMSRYIWVSVLKTVLYRK